MKPIFILSPAYGRDYKNESDAVEAYESGVDFINETQHFTGGGTYISNRDITASHVVVKIRYNRRKNYAFLNTERV